MAPKKKCFNGFSVFMTETQQALAEKGIKMSMSDMPDYCKKDWEQMPNGMKEMYKAKGKKMKKELNVTKYTSIGEKVDDIKQKSIDTKSQADAMYLYIEELVRVHPVSHYLSRQKFILIYVNPYACENKGFYFPAEISMAEFSLQRGLIRVYHQLVGFDKVRTKAPPAPTADINNHAQNNHLITTYSKLSLNYTNILLKIIGFIMEKDVDESVLNDSTLDLPPIYTAHCFTENELTITNSSLYQLYRCAVKDADKDYFNCFLRVYHLDKLFMEMKNLSYKTQNPYASEKEAMPSVAMATEALSKDVLNTIISVGCSFHDKLGQSHVCSNYYVCKWIYIISTHCCQYFNIKLIPGCHYDFDLSSTETPLEKIVENLNINKKFNFLNNSLTTTNNFPSLNGEFSSTVVQQPVWNTPQSKSYSKMSTLNKTISNNVNDYPSLDGGLQNVVSEKTFASETNKWQKNTSLGRGQVLSNPNQLKIVKKLPKGKGFDVGEK